MTGANDDQIILLEVAISKARTYTALCEGPFVSYVLGPAMDRDFEAGAHGQTDRRVLLGAAFASVSSFLSTPTVQATDTFQFLEPAYFFLLYHPNQVTACLKCSGLLLTSVSMARPISPSLSRKTSSCFLILQRVPDAHYLTPTPALPIHQRTCELLEDRGHNY